MENFFVIVEFADGLQMVPNTWLINDMTECLWPLYTKNERCDRAVRFMEPPEKEWQKHSIKRIMATASQ